MSSLTSVCHTPSTLSSRMYPEFGHKECDMDVSSVVKYSIDTPALHFDQLWVSALTAVHWTEKLLWWVLCEGCTNLWVQRQGFREWLDPCSFSKTIVIAASFGPRDTFQLCWDHVLLYHKHPSCSALSHAGPHDISFSFVLIHSQSSMANAIPTLCFLLPIQSEFKFS